MNRREFLQLGMAAAVTGARAPLFADGSVSVSANRTVFLSDIHLGTAGLKTAWGVEPTYQNAIFDRQVGKILALNPLPKRVVIAGDLSVWFGYASDYAAALPGIKRLEAAGIEVILTAGNHDHREPMRQTFGKRLETTCVQDRFVRIVDLGTADLLLLDTLQETGKGAGAGNASGGALDDAQWKWLKDEIAARKRPFFLGSHHPPNEIAVRDFRTPLLANRLVAGWIHGHRHVWDKQWYMEPWRLKRYCRIASLPSCFADDIGFAILDTAEGGAELRLEQDDFFFPEPAKSAAARPPLWDRILEEHRGQVCNFIYE